MDIRKATTAVIVAAAAAVAGYLIVPVVRPASAAPKTHAVSAKTGLQVGDYPPNFTLTDIHGKPVTLSSLRGHAVWLNFWATWCPWCRTEMPDMQTIHQQYGNQIKIYGIDVQQTGSTVTGWLQAHGIHYDVLLDKTGQVATNYAVQSLPMSFFIAPDGRIVAVNDGAILNLSTMRGFVNRAIHGH